jgi:hypothetical protein
VPYLVEVGKEKDLLELLAPPEQGRGRLSIAPKNSCGVYASGLVGSS